MSTINILHRTAGGAPTMIPSAPDVRPPVAPPQPPATEPLPPQEPRPSWPSSAKLAVALLVVAGLIATFAAAIFSGGDDGDAELLAEIETITEERDAALAEVTDLDDQLVVLQGELDEALSNNGLLSIGIEQLGTKIVELTAERDEALATVVELTAERDEALATIGDVTGERDEALAEVAALNADLTDVRDELEQITAERDALAAALPYEFDVSLVGLDLAGRYATTVTDVYGTTPKFTEVALTTTPEGWLRLSIPGVAEGPVFRVGDVLHMVTGSTIAVPACDGVTRVAQVTATILPSQYEVGFAGAHHTGLDMVITIHAPATGTCAAALAFGSAALTHIA